ncbi:MAG: hypothetical protein KGZ61_07330 [Sandarakinorhabdus sp.]|nr:hypothetical protein [Sandarakinorhabdus sp.]
MSANQADYAIAALRHDGLTAPRVIDCPMNRRIFQVYVETQLAPTLKPGDMVRAKEGKLQAVSTSRLLKKGSMARR